MAEHAAGSDDERKKVRDERLRAEQERLDAADAARRREEEERQRDLERVHQASLAEIHAAEVKANSKLNPNGQFSKEGAVEWSDLEKSAPSVDGVLERFDCLGPQGRIVIHTAPGKLVRLLVTDPSRVSIQGSDGALACGAQKPARKVHVSYDQRSDQKTGTSGEVRAIQFVPVP
jgi:ATPase subunit of ABC transporter with duplicated ATPase domains